VSAAGLVDSHCHLDHQQYASELEAILERAHAAGVQHFLAIGTGDGPPILDVAIRIAERFPQCWATVGVHPHDASKADERTFDELRALSKHPKVVAIGEIGLDYHYDFSPRERQREVFLEQIRIARDAGKPLIIHTREAWDDTLAVLEGPGVLHCFTGDAEQARQAVDLGFHLGFGGVVTFPKSYSLREAARMVPENRILVETDCPYLSPVPFRGKRNEPAYLPHTVRKLAEVRGVGEEDLARITTRNFEDLFGLRVLKPNGYTGTSDGPS
jgi:TatD DNase family protein